MPRVDLTVETGAQKRRRFYDLWKAEGRCVNCGGTERAPGKLKCEPCRSISARASVRYAHRMADDAYAAYGGPVCACCGEKTRCFLTLDHVDGGGSAHRRSIIEAPGSNSLYVWLKKNGYPPGYQVLCQNCNIGRWRNGGTCPHAAH